MLCLVYNSCILCEHYSEWYSLSYIMIQQDESYEWEQKLMCWGPWEMNDVFKLKFPWEVFLLIHYGQFLVHDTFLHIHVLWALQWSATL